jgi:hypothetical protein
MEVLMKKRNIVSMRLDDEEYQVVEMLAKELKTNPSDAARTLLFEGVKSVTNRHAADNKENENQNDMQNIQLLYDKLAQEIQVVRQNLDSLAFSTFYHFLPVGEEQKDEANRSAWERFFKYKIIARKIDNESAAKKSGTAKSS